MTNQKQIAEEVLESIKENKGWTNYATQGKIEGILLAWRDGLKFLNNIVICGATTDINSIPKVIIEQTKEIDNRIQDLKEAIKLIEKLE